MKPKTIEEKKKVEGMVMSKIGKRKYSLDQNAWQIPNELMEKIKPS